jgi:hypothetical protein
MRLIITLRLWRDKRMNYSLFTAWRAAAEQMRGLR